MGQLLRIVLLNPQDSLIHLHQNSVLADFFCENGVVCAKKDVIEILKELEGEGIIEVSREPSHTDRGAATKFWSDDKGKKVYLKRKA